MKGTLRKPWGENPAGTIVSTEPEEGAVLVGAKRWAYFVANGYFEPEPKPEGKATRPRGSKPGDAEVNADG